MKKQLVATSIIAVFSATNAHAFGLGDIVSIGIQTGTKVIGAAVDAGVDKVKESMRDPEAEAREKAEQKRKLAEAFQKQADEIEAMPNLRPLDREKMILILRNQQKWAQQMQSFAAEAEARQKAERDKIFTASGFLGVVGKAALNTPSMAVARADAMTKDPVWRAEQRMRNEAVFAQADAQVAAGIPQAKSRVVLAQADMLQKSGINEAGTKAVMNTADAMTEAHITKQDLGTVAGAAANAKEDASRGTTATADAGQTQSEAVDAGAAAASASPKDAFTPDLGRKLYVEFVGSPSETEKLKTRLRAMGHTLVESKDEAEVVYLMEGEYSIQENRLHDGVTLSIGDLLETPDKPIPTPKKKLTGTLSLGLSKLMLGVAAAQGAQVPNGAIPQEGVYPQESLLVIARQPKGGKETRFHVLKHIESEILDGAGLAKTSRDELYAALGMSEQAASSSPQASKEDAHSAQKGGV
jgi:preprotein translocase subunit YajC